MCEIQAPQPGLQGPASSSCPALLTWNSYSWPVPQSLRTCHAGPQLCTVSLLHTNLQALNSHKYECTFHQHQAWMQLQLATPHSISYCWWSFSSIISYLLSLLQAVTLLACSRIPAPVYQLLYCTTVLSKVLYCKIENVFLLFVFVFVYMLFMWKVLQTYYSSVLYNWLC